MEQESPIRTGPSVPKTDKKKKLNVKENMAGWLFATPWIIGLLIFFAFPLFSSIYFSFTNYSVLQPAEFVGLANYKALFQDDLFWVSIYNTVYFAVFFVPLSIIFGVALAMILNLRVKGMAVYRTIFFLPTLVPHVAIAVLWVWMLNPQYGLVNGFLDLIGIQGPPCSEARLGRSRPLF